MHLELKIDGKIIQDVDSKLGNYHIVLSSIWSCKINYFKYVIPIQELFVVVIVALKCLKEM